IFFFFNAPPTTEISTLSLHDALPIYIPNPASLIESDIVGPVIGAGAEFVPLQQQIVQQAGRAEPERRRMQPGCARHLVDHHQVRSEEHTSELQSRSDLVCRLLLEKKK